MLRMIYHADNSIGMRSTSLMYIHGEDSMVADALLRLPDEEHKSKAPHVVWGVGVNATLSISTDHSVLNAIIDSYKSDSFCKKVSKMNIPGVKLVNGLWYISSHLLIPGIGDIHDHPLVMAASEVPYIDNTIPTTCCHDIFITRLKANLFDRGDMIR